MKKETVFLLLIAVLLMSSCDRHKNRLRQKNLNGAIVGLLAGSIQVDHAKNSWPEGNYRSFKTNDETLMALRKGDVEALYVDELAMYNPSYDKQLMAIAFIDNDHQAIAGALRPQDVEMERQFALFLKEIKANGVYVRMKNRWTMTERPDTITPYQMPAGRVTRVLKVGIIGEMPPYSLCNHGRWTGFENELWTLFAEHMGYGIEFTVYNFKELIPALLRKDIDVVASAMTVTDERSHLVLFTQPYAYSCSVCLMRK